MPFYDASTKAAIANMRLGIRVDLAATSVAAISTKTLFTITGGNCVLLGLVAESTTGQAAGANNAKFISTPTAGTAVDLCAAADIASTEIGGLLHISGAVADAMIALATGAGGGIMMTTPLVVAPGVIGFNTAADTAGSFKFSLWYVPVEDGAYISGVVPSLEVSTQDRIADILLGMRVERPATSVAGATTKSVFTVVGGNVIVYGLLAESTTGQAAGANAVTWKSTPTVGTAINLSGGVGDINAHEAGGFVSLSGTLASNTLVTTAGAAQLLTTPLVVPPGVIGFATAGNTAGSYKFSIWYAPAEDGAYVIPTP